MQKVFLSDFDGTITERDVIHSIMENFAPPIWKNILNELMTGKIDIDIGIKKMFNLIPSDKKEEIINWVLENIKIREGFDDFLDFLNENNILFVILSGGIDFYINPLIEPYKDKIHKIYSNKAIFKKDYIDVEFIYKCDGVCKRSCGVCKPYIIKKDFKNYFKFYAGDGITDLTASEYVDFIFATGSLQKYLKNKDFFSFDNFYQIREFINEKFILEKVKGI